MLKMLSHDVKNALLTTRLCQYLEPQELDMLIIHNRIVSFPPGKIILEQGKKSEAMYIIIQGKATVSVKILGEGAATIATLDHGNFIGEIALIDKGPCATSVMANDYVECLQITSVYFDMLLLFFPETRFKLNRAIAREVYYRLQDEYYKITNYMNHVQMTTRTIFGEVIKSLGRPGKISFEEAGIDMNELAHEQIFKSFTPEEFKQLIHHANLIKTSKNYTIIPEQDRELICFVVLRGAVQSSIIQNNKIGKLSVLGPTSLIASLSCIESSFSSVINYTTCESAVLLKFDETHLLHLQKRYIRLWYKLFELICKSTVGLERSADKLDVRLNSELYNR